VLNEAVRLLKFFFSIEVKKSDDAE